ncbi:hypothetical protein J5N97_020537 [Dioscorea zingiberensis]|uniref:CG-1 domain-containing protein n=1 Tax=Dioscorea zingiberensis TaxID=325984 RepID=A0A9D5CHA7_9LILI|nr:hypothetical protein J5N97_020537 [Dioscorea zingiberensis]
MQPGFDIDKLRQDAQTRWLKPSEVFFILQNHELYAVSREAPKQPPSGSLFLFNRRVLRFFRKDGHMWRKKKDGRTVGEAHERLKVGNVDALNCYYAHGEKNPYFQRRSYWMLDPAYEHIVLVHYREVAEGRYISRSNELFEPYQSYASPVSVEEVSSKFVLENLEKNCKSTLVGSENHNSTSQSEVNLALGFAEQLSLDNDEGSIYFEEKLPPFCIQDQGSEHLGAPDYEPRGSSQDSPGNLLHEYNYRHTVHDQVEEVGKQGGYNAVHALHFAGDTDSEKQLNQSVSPAYSTDSREPSWNYMMNLSSNSAVMGASGRINSFTSGGVPESINCRAYASGTGLNAGDDTPLSLERKRPSIALNEPSEMLPWDQLDGEGDSAVNLTNGQQISEEELSLQLSATRMFLLGSDSPLPEVEKPLDYTGETTDPEAGFSMMLRKENGTGWAGSVTSAVEHSTYSPNNSEMWFDQSQFGNLLVADSSLAVAQKQRFSIREISPEWAFISERTKVIITGDFLCNPSECSWAVMFGDTEVPAEIVQEATPIVDLGTEVEPFRYIKLTDDMPELYKSPLFSGENQSATMDLILQELLKDKLDHWLLSRWQGNESTNCLLSKQEQGIIHIISGLGYEWALNPILNSGVGINFRDTNGWTALHWAAALGREKMVIALLTAGASAGAVTDPTAQDPAGKNPAAIAAACGHKGLAGYLSEVALTSHLSSLILEKSGIVEGSTEVGGERPVKSMPQKSVQMNIGGTEAQLLSLKDTLEAIRNSAQAAARIQSAFSSIEAGKSKDFLNLRQNVVKIQAYVRGHQVRKKYKKVLWTVSIVEKAILRWRRKGAGLRGFRAESDSIDENDDEDIAKEFRKQKVDAVLDEAFSRVQSMVDFPEAQQQYRRLLESYRQAKAEARLSYAVEAARGISRQYLDFGR